MNDQRTQLEKKYYQLFGEPEMVAHNVMTEPHVDVYIFHLPDDFYLYLTLGLSFLGFTELFTLTKNLEQWPAYFFNSICYYEISEKVDIQINETYEASGLIKNVPKDFNHCLILRSDLAGFTEKDLKASLGLINAPRFIYPITRKELDFKLANKLDLLLHKIGSQPNYQVLAEVDRPGTV